MRTAALFILFIVVPPSTSLPSSPAAGPVGADPETEADVDFTKLNSSESLSSAARKTTAPPTAVPPSRPEAARLLHSGHQHAQPDAVGAGTVLAGTEASSSAPDSGTTMTDEPDTGPPPKRESDTTDTQLSPGVQPDTEGTYTHSGTGSNASQSQHTQSRLTLEKQKVTGTETSAEYSPSQEASTANPSPKAAQTSASPILTSSVEPSYNHGLVSAEYIANSKGGVESMQKAELSAPEDSRFKPQRKPSSGWKPAQASLSQSGQTQSTQTRLRSQLDTRKAHSLTQNVEDVRSPEPALTEMLHLTTLTAPSVASAGVSPTAESASSADPSSPHSTPLSEPLQSHTGPPHLVTPFVDPLSPVNGLLSSSTDTSLPTQGSPSPPPEPSDPVLSHPNQLRSSPTTAASSDAAVTPASELAGALEDLVTRSGSHTAADCQLELPAGTQRWRPGTDIQITFPLTIPGACTPAEQCSVSTVLDQHVTVQTTDRITVKFEVSATGGGSPAAASLALRRADPGTTDCPVDHGEAPPALLVSANQRRLFGSDLLLPGVNHFFGRISLYSEECFRLVVTVRSADCGDLRQPCSDRGHCVAAPEQHIFKCTCCPRAGGQYCEVTDPCAGHRCPPGATCAPHGYSYRCTCRRGDMESNCTLAGVPCAACQNGGTCAVGEEEEEEEEVGARCVCPQGFTGVQCERRVEVASDPCLSSPCRHGACRSDRGVVRCLCSPGYSGQLCETEEACSTAPCQNGGTCRGLPDGGFSCSCPSGYRGRVCQHRVLPLCTVHPCANGGTCWDEGTYYYCTCQHGFVGKHCEVPPGVIGHFDIHHVRSGAPVMAALMVGLLIVITVVGCCYCRSAGARQMLGRHCRPLRRWRAALRCCPRHTYKQFSEDQRKNLVEMGYSHAHQPIVEPMFADVDHPEAAEMPLIT